MRWSDGASIGGRGIVAVPIEGVPPIKKGDDLANIASSLFGFEDGDVLAIASTVVSKSEGRVLELSSIVPTERARRIAERCKKPPAFVQAVLDESEEVLVEHPFLLVVRKGHVCVNAGIDASNVEEGKVLLLPDEPDKSAERIRQAIERLTGRRVGVIITDTSGRPFRVGQCGVALGCAGLVPIKSWIGVPDMHGRPLEITEEAIADELAALANVLMGEANGMTPMVVIRGMSDVVVDEGMGASTLLRRNEEDVVRAALRLWRASRAH
ncbi:coenzyme F420-0:L-glutamate ligase [Methermicoccus shengliensis]|uniref:Coenzyme F420-0:L-glutamate ligase n=1 Tax=Methermicoccus shengliensis TaxID=660064 RepID=A0A832VMV3_9EURY|nr:coenzyme F420-0:L-glutamate ligase [Methermicoccus shengliensis]KUK04704.1 MAG: Coenzyme F420:L-glutamate ligase [Euryarchaeota archaeon 55_53]KUK30529.1 MAG: Coenzyme F420:L-glutamate ligase [Methanosarcinales archeaon 56_1174]MDI3487436.1 coenzyme F420-0:L-glutamate ligase / coenzyme F420:gamma-L-glutamate ligase [Methanosarcinales archaeon]MDN5295235.1 coenzyme F420-0:L-glutamate ligase / coenzyme F420:gamma-L-glutamate ligase [Methanosarcinales archaeon]HIH69676.1 coenzyme F420-0:L-glut